MSAIDIAPWDETQAMAWWEANRATPQSRETSVDPNADNVPTVIGGFA